MKRYHVLVTDQAEFDLEDIYRFVASHDSPIKAERLLSEIESLCERLSHNPNRGHVCPELERIGVKIYRELHWQPYRVIYQVASDKVYIHAVLDGRRDLPMLLERRLLRHR